MSNFEAMEIRGIVREIKHELSDIVYDDPDMNMVVSLEEVKEHISKLQGMITNIIVTDEKNNE